MWFAGMHDLVTGYYRARSPRNHGRRRPAPAEEISFWESVTHGAKKGASAAKKTAEKSKLQAEIVMLKQQIKQAKQGMGVAIYDALSLANEAEVQRVFGVRRDSRRRARGEDHGEERAHRGTRLRERGAAAARPPPRAL